MVTKFKIHWLLNAVAAAVVFIILLAIFLYRYFTVGTPIEANWGEEIGKYLVMWPVLWAICCVICYAPFRALSSYLAKKAGKDVGDD